MTPVDTIFQVAILIMSVVIHEVAHGFTADRLGDPTARMAGRLTLNPFKHLDLFGSIILPFLLIISHTGFVFGWAKPVPYNPNNLRNRRTDTIKVAIAGILTNAAIAVIFSFILRAMIFTGTGSEALLSIVSSIVLVNILLAFFNILPIPPLDGSKIFFSLFLNKFRNLEYYMDRYGFIVLVLFIVFLWQYMTPAISFLFFALTGVHIQ